MIPALLAALGVAAVGAGTAARWIYRRVRTDHAGADDARARRTGGDPLEGEPIALGDVLVLDGGRGPELWLVRSLACREPGGDAFIILFEVYPRVGARAAVVGWDPLRPEAFALLTPHEIAGAAGLAHARTSRPPSTVEVAIDGRTETLQLTMRRVARATAATVTDAEAPSLLPAPGDGFLVATYRGGADARAVLLRDRDGALRGYVGRRVPFEREHVLRAEAARAAR